MQPYQQRVVDEKTELDAKLEKLAAFIQSDAFRMLNVHEADLLKEQHMAMKCYSRILAERIAAFSS